jgi:hypothetical protein
MPSILLIHGTGIDDWLLEDDGVMRMMGPKARPHPETDGFSSENEGD